MALADDMEFLVGQVGATVCVAYLGGDPGEPLDESYQATAGHTGRPGLWARGHTVEVAVARLRAKADTSAE